jgi:hypothetical protein
VNRRQKSEPPLRITNRGYLVFGILWGASFVAAMVTANIGLPGWSM